MEEEYEIVLFDKNEAYYYDREDMERVIKYYNKYKTGNKEADKELLQDLMKTVKRYRIDDVDELIELLEYQYQL